MTVFVTDGLLRKSLSATRSLGEYKIPVVVGEKTRWTPSGFSGFCNKAVVYPDPLHDQHAFSQWLLEHIKAHKYHLVLPMDDATLEGAMAVQSQLETFTQVILPPPKSYFIARDKLETARLAEKAGVLCPKTYATESIEDLKSLVKELEYPVVIKPKHSSGSRGIKVVYNQEECLTSYLEIRKQYSSLLIQEYIPLGPRYDVCLLFNREGEVRAEFVQKEIRHFPIDMGPSTMQESVDYPQLIDISLRLMSHLPWSGVVELEYMIDPRDGEPKLLEINPRFWNSLECAHLSGINFPLLLYKMAMEGDVQRIRDYEVGKRCSNILLGETLHYFFNKKRRQMQPPYLARRKYGVVDDVLSLKDPLPTVGFLFALIRYLFDAQMWRLVFKRGG